MSTSPSSATWRRLIDRAHDGDPRHLLELLLQPTQVDGHNTPLPGSFTDLPDDGDLRQRIVELLVFGPLRRGWGGADNLGDLMTKTGFGGRSPDGKGVLPRRAEIEIDAAALYLDAGATPDEFSDLAAAHGVGAEYLRNLIRKRKKSRPGK